MKKLAEAKAAERANLAKTLTTQLDLAAGFLAKNSTLLPTQAEAMQGLLRNAHNLDPKLLESPAAKALLAQFPTALGVAVGSTQNPELARQADILGDRNGRVTPQEYARLAIDLDMKSQFSDPVQRQRFQAQREEALNSVYGLPTKR